MPSSLIRKKDVEVVEAMVDKQSCKQAVWKISKHLLVFLSVEKVMVYIYIYIYIIYTSSSCG